MQFVTFPVQSTNIFPIANSAGNGALLSEYNLRARECVNTDPTIEYIVGPSYTHSMRDYYVSVEVDGSGVVTSSSSLQISPGRAVFNGHYVETLTPMVIDMAKANVDAQAQSLPPLNGNLSVGVKVFYSTEDTMAGAMQVSNNDMYIGVQIVILPTNEFITPLDSPSDQSRVTADIKLADFSYVNGTITNILNNEGKVQNLSPDRIGNVSGLLSAEYMKKTGLNPKMLYVFSGKGTDPTTKQDTWFDSPYGLIVCDHRPKLTTDAPNMKQAKFVQSIDGVNLMLPHKQVDGMTDQQGNPQYYAPNILPIPVASYEDNSAGVVNAEYTNKIKAIRSDVDKFYALAGGKQRGYLPVLRDREELPDLQTAGTTWENGDYILVGQDFTVYSGTSRAPSTIYVVTGRVAQAITYITQASVAVNVGGTSIKRTPQQAASVLSVDYPQLSGSLKQIIQTDDPQEGNTSAISVALLGQGDKIPAIANTDYVVAVKPAEEDRENYYFYSINSTADPYYSDPIYLTHELGLADETTICGFYNVPSTQLDKGYVYLDETGHLRLLDYGLLRTGTLAYQLGQDVMLSSGLTYEAIQEQLDDFVNERVAFPDSNQLSKSTGHPEIIELTITLPSTNEPAVVNIQNIDSRFGSSIYLHILGEANANTTINIKNCQKIRIDNNIKGYPVINLYNSCLYYDATVLNYLSDIDNMTLWYTRYTREQPDLTVNYMTVSDNAFPTVSEDFTFWSPTNPNDNHYEFALQSVTFGSDGSIIGCGLYVTNSTTANVTTGTTIASDKFTLPQGSGLTYPTNRLTKLIKVSGNFTTAYSVDSPKDSFIVIDNSFTAMLNPTGKYSSNEGTSGTIAFRSNAQLISYAAVGGVGSIDGWEPGKFHLFFGGAVT